MGWLKLRESPPGGGGGDRPNGGGYLGDVTDGVLQLLDIK